MGLTKYSPNTDCEQKEGDEQKGASNWLRSFRDNGLKRSKETRGFVVQLQEDTKRERSDMQVAEQEMAGEVVRTGVPVIGMYGDIQLWWMSSRQSRWPKSSGVGVSRTRWSTLMMVTSTGSTSRTSTWPSLHAMRSAMPRRQ
mmetsp:Transcript_8723/g.22471  ORF Transcript_8723/g.22471 Transcript_8723/m.22471 type:complete len:142 (-) Transcript_8723:377-802(-)